MQIELKWNETDKRRFLSAVGKIGKAVKFQIESPGILPKTLAIKFTEQMRIAIITQKWVSKWGVRGRRYHPKYEKWKKEQVGHSLFWKLQGDLLAALQQWKVTEGWFSGVPITAMDSGGKNFSGKGKSKPIAMYGTILEEGGQHGGMHPARPVFEHTFNEFSFSSSRPGKSFGVTYSGGLAWALCEKALVQIGDHWR